MASDTNAFALQIGLSGLLLGLYLALHLLLSLTVMLFHLVCSQQTLALLATDIHVNRGRTCAAGTLVSMGILVQLQSMQRAFNNTKTVVKGSPSAAVGLAVGGESGGTQAVGSRQCSITAMPARRFTCTAQVMQSQAGSLKVQVGWLSQGKAMRTLRRWLARPHSSMRQPLLCRREGEFQIGFHRSGECLCSSKLYSPRGVLAFLSVFCRDRC